MSIENKLNKLKDTKARIKAAIEAKGVSNVGDVFGEYPNKIAAIPSGGGGETKWSGHADAEGLKAIGWTDDDIAYYQKYGVNWNEEDDEYHKVPQSNIELYGVINENNMDNYKNILVYCPKFDGLSGRTCDFYNFYILEGLPILEYTRGIPGTLFVGCYNLYYSPKIIYTGTYTTTSLHMFSGCKNLRNVVLFDSSKIYNINSMFNECNSLRKIPQFDFSEVTNTERAFLNCYALEEIPDLKIGKFTNTNQTFMNCYKLRSIEGILDVESADSLNNTFSNCLSLQTVNIKNLKISIDIADSPLSKESVLYMINNSIAESPITITLKQSVYDAMSVDNEVQAALEAKPNVSLAGK